MRINQVVRTLVLSDFFVNAGFSVFAPVFAIFVTQQVVGGSLEVIGFGAAIVQIAKIIVELPLSKILDKNHGEYDDFYSMVFGSFLIAAVPFLYLLARLPIHIYIIEAIYGVGIGFSAPPWYAIFSRHLDKMQESFEWTLDSVSLGLGAAAAAALGGTIAQHYGFHSVFILGGLFAIFGGITQVFIFHNIKKKVPRGAVRPGPDKVAL
jgi:MFS family permease